jgi:hypothetical protein
MGTSQTNTHSPHDAIGIIYMVGNELGLVSDARQALGALRHGLAHQMRFLNERGHRALGRTQPDKEYQETHKGTRHERLRHFRIQVATGQGGTRQQRTAAARALQRRPLFHNRRQLRVQCIDSTFQIGDDALISCRQCPGRSDWTKMNRKGASLQMHQRKSKIMLYIFQTRLDGSWFRNFSKVIGVTPRQDS